MWNTGELEAVYNLRVADHHTYFVGDEGWGWAAWAHNLYFYHGTSKSNAASILNSSINANLFEPKKDFGFGFYTTTDSAQAIDWAKTKIDGGAVLRYFVPDAQYAALTHTDYGSAASPEWQRTVWRGRQGELDVSPNPIGTDTASGLVRVHGLSCLKTRGF